MCYRFSYFEDRPHIPIILKNSEDIKNIIIQVNSKNNSTSVFSGFSAWENIAYILEGLGATVQECIRQGISRREAYGAVKKYILKVLPSYDV